MSWKLNLLGTASECHNSLEEVALKAKSGRSVVEAEHINLAVELFKRLVPYKADLQCNFVASGYVGEQRDLVFNYMCNVHP